MLGAAQFSRWIRPQFSCFKLIFIVLEELGPCSPAGRARFRSPAPISGRHRRRGKQIGGGAVSAPGRRIGGQSKRLAPSRRLRWVDEAHVAALITAASSAATILALVISKA